MKQTFETLKTPFYDKVNREIPWNEYPRPTMVGDSFICLNGYWDFCESSENFAKEFKKDLR